MKNYTLSILICFSYLVTAQSNNYYETCNGLEGEELKEELHNIIKDHTSFSYTTTKSILRESDEDPNNPSNIILLYTGNSIDKFDFSSNFEPDFWNREHVWPKSHGDFDAGDPFEVPLYTDAHNLKPVDASMNTIRGEKDFDNGGETVLNGTITTSCLTTSSTFEPRDEVKGDVARMILYMDVRYEGGDNEPNLVPVDGLTTYPNPQIGVLSTLLEWHELDPPDAFEKRRNDVIYEWQGNRNPFIDYPEFVDIIYNNSTANPIQIDNVETPNPINGGESFIITANVTSAIDCPVLSVTLNYGNSWADVSNNIEMTLNENGQYTCEIPAQAYNTMFCYSISAMYFEICEETSQTFFGSEIIPPFPFEGVITPISEIQGETDYSPYEGETVNTTGIVTGAFANSFYIQDGSEPWSGIYIYSGEALPSMGDSVIVSGEISEFCWNGAPCSCSTCGGAGVTEFYQPENIYIISNNNPLPEPILVSTGEALTEQYEGVLIRMENVECTSLPGGFGVWQVDDGSGTCGIHNTPDGYEFDPQIGETYNITGVVTSTFNEWKVDLRMPSDVETGPDTTAPYILTHTCYMVGQNYYVYLYFNEDINPDFLDINNFLITNATIQNIAADIFDPTKITLTLSEVLDPTMGIIISEMADLNGNIGTNLIYSIDCSNEFWVEDINEHEYNFNLYPNPNNGYFNLELYNKSNIVSIYNVDGKLVLTQEVGNGVYTFNLKKRGFYYLKINNYETAPLIIQ
jgi:endonuclease I